MIRHQIARILRTVANRVDGPLTIHTHLSIDGREVARAVANAARSGDGGAGLLTPRHRMAALIADHREITVMLVLGPAAVILIEWLVGWL